MRVLVTGSTGYIGSVLMPMLIERGHDVVGIDLGLFRALHARRRQPWTSRRPRSVTYVTWDPRTSKVSMPSSTWQLFPMIPSVT